MRPEGLRACGSRWFLVDIMTKTWVGGRDWSGQGSIIEIYRRNQREAATEDKIWEAKAAIRVGVLIKPGSPSPANGSLSFYQCRKQGDVDLLRRESVEIHGSWEISQPRSGLASVQLLTAQGLNKWFLSHFMLGKMQCCWLDQDLHLVEAFICQMVGCRLNYNKKVKLSPWTADWLCVCVNRGESHQQKSCASVSAAPLSFQLVKLNLRSSVSFDALIEDQ